MPRIERAGRAYGNDVHAVHGPDRRRTIVALPQDVGPGIEVVIAGALDMPARPRIERTHSTKRKRIHAVHQPDRRRAVGALPQDVGPAVVVEVAGTLDLP